MPKPTKGPRLGGSSSHQKALLANLATSLFEHGRIKTTEPKARALRPYAEKLITHAKKGTLHNRREVMKKIRDKDVVHTLFAEIGPFFADRDGGYTRIIKVEARKGDNAPMAVIELVREKTVTSEADRARRAAASKKAAPVAAAAAPQAAVEPEAAVGPSRGDGRRGQGRGRRHRGGPGSRGRRRGRRGRGRRRRPTTRPTTPSSEARSNMPAIDSGGGLVRLRLDIAYDGTDFAGWATQAGQRTVAGVIDDALSTVFRTPVRVRGPRAAPTPACTPPVRWRTSTCPPTRCRTPTRAPRAPGEQRFLPLVRRLARFLPDDVRVLDISRARSGFRRPVLGAAPPLRLPAVDRAVRRRAAGGAVRDAVAAAAGRRRDGRRVAGIVGAARLRGVLPSPRRRDDDPRSAAAGLDARRRPASPRTSPPTRSAGRWCGHWSARCWRWGSTAANPAGAQRC